MIAANKITVTLTDEQSEAIGRAYFDEVLPECSVVTDIKDGELMLFVRDQNGSDDLPIELVIGLDKTIRKLSIGNYIASDCEELQTMVESLGRTYEFMKGYLDSYKEEIDEENKA